MNKNEFNYAIKELMNKINSKLSNSEFEKISKTTLSEENYSKVLGIIDAFSPVEGLSETVKYQSSTLKSLKSSFDSHMLAYSSEFTSLSKKCEQYEQILGDFTTKYNDLKTTLNLKANRESVASALHRKANKQDISIEVMFGSGSNSMQMILTNLGSEFKKYATLGMI